MPPGLGAAEPGAADPSPAPPPRLPRSPASSCPTRAVQHGEIIGQRLHPVTRRLVIYMTARLAKGASSKTFIGDRTELSAVRWVSPAEAAELLPDMFQPVREYLGRVVRRPR